jgi:hypothetical protein
MLNSKWIARYSGWSVLNGKINPAVAETSLAGTFLYDHFHRVFAHQLVCSNSARLLWSFSCLAIAVSSTPIGFERRGQNKSFCYHFEADNRRSTPEFESSFGYGVIPV